MNYSFIVAAYNIEKYIEQCLYSLSKITLPFIEFIVVNDGSTDKTGLLIDKFLKLDFRFKVLNKDNGGLVSARKLGLKKAIGKYVIFIDGDDYVIPENFIEIDKVISSKNPDLVIYNYQKEFNNKLITIKFREKYLSRKTQKSFISLVSNNLNLSTYLWNKVFLRANILKIYRYVSNQITIGEDAAVTFPYYIFSKKIVTIDISFYVYRQHQSSMLKTISNVANDLFRFKELYKTFRKVLPISYDKQINLFLNQLCVVRFGGTKIGKDQEFQFLLKKAFNKIVIIYSTGTFGQKIYQFNENFKFFNFIGFIDEDHNESLKLGLNMVKLEEISRRNIDYVIIASVSMNDSIKIEKNLIKYILKEKILKFSPKIINSINIEAELNHESN